MEVDRRVGTRISVTLASYHVIDEEAQYVEWNSTNQWFPSNRNYLCLVTYIFKAFTLN
jgi:hypothetical protein